MVYEYLIELFSYSYVGVHLSRFQQLLVTVGLHSYDVQKKKKKRSVLGPKLCRKSENWFSLKIEPYSIKML